ncbi:hypothetical protein BDW22DRAFT_22873 [Trametopsis cervina]|nr:hypothetical protein BDW22DRAFT_22873 [Trametopsis cervina]
MTFILYLFIIAVIVYLIELPMQLKSSHVIEPQCDVCETIYIAGKPYTGEMEGRTMYRKLGGGQDECVRAHLSRGEVTDHMNLGSHRRTAAFHSIVSAANDAPLARILSFVRTSETQQAL